jgi:iron(III) transport system substrate-binding protein
MRFTMKKLIVRTSCLLALAASAAQGAEVNLYTTREPGLIKNLLEAYTTKTGVKVNTVFLKDGLAERVLSEGEKSPADVLMTVDFANLVDLTAKGVTQAIDSPTLAAAVPAHLRDPNRHWFALSLRVRTLYTAKGSAPQRFAYEELADPKWKGKVCLRSGQHPYNNALIAHLIARDGAAKTEAWLRGVKANLARKPGGGDREIARDIMGGLCEIGLGNSYYVAIMRSGKGGPDQQKWGEAIDVVLPVLAAGDGSHANISGAAIAKYAPNKPEAIRLLEFLVSDEAQDIYARANYEYPVKPGVATDPLIAVLGALKVDTLSLGEIAKYRKQASELVDKTGFDN